MRTAHIPYDSAYAFKLTDEKKQELAEGLQPEAICNLIEQAWVVWRNIVAETIQLFVLPPAEEEISVGYIHAPTPDPVPSQFTYPLADLFDESSIGEAMRGAFRDGKVHELDTPANFITAKRDPQPGQQVQVAGYFEMLQF